MSSNGQDKSRMATGKDNKSSELNLNKVPDESSSIVRRISQSSSADEPYFAHARMGARSDHMNYLTSQLDATDKLLRK
ncbi:hypothetical protein BJX61DRAFT_538571 [Aspergillus egyptiacus]|nr:hypothetical protein BJX61DRAFT_538571 [Aspergillus egyptiacus]